MLGAMFHVRHLGSLSILLLAACSAGAPEAAAPDTEGAASQAPADEETERDRTIRLATDKRLQCDTLADTIQGEPEIDIIANINDGAALEKVAAQLDQSIHVLEALSVSDATLADLHEAYVAILRGKAKALRSVAATADDAEKKQQLKIFQKHNDEVAGTIDGINQACGAHEGSE